MTRPPAERIAVLVASLAAAGSAYLFRSVDSGSKTKAEEAGFSGAHYARQLVVNPAPEWKQWDEPLPVRNKSPWAYDLFTPPNVVYNEQTKKFVLVGSNANGATASRANSPAPIPFCVQLVGYVGNADRYLGVFENVLTSEIIVAGEGAVLMNHAFIVGKIEVRKKAADFNGRSSPVTFATAVIRDILRDEDVVLTDAAKVYVGSKVGDGPIVQDVGPTVSAPLEVSFGESAGAAVQDVPSAPHDDRLHATTELPAFESENPPETSQLTPDPA
jgi:hypothetical protein